MCIRRKGGHPAAEIEPYTTRILCCARSSVPWKAVEFAGWSEQRFSSRSGVLAPTLSFCSHIHGGDPRHCKPARQARRCGLHPSSSSCCWIQSQVAGCPRNVHSRPRLRPGVFQSLPSRPPAVPLYPLLATLAFTSSYFKISFTPKVQLSSSSHTLPPLLVPPGRSKHFDAFTGNHPEHLGPGSSRRKLQLLCGR